MYVAANDGMLHAFDASTGAELWAFVPSFVRQYAHLGDSITAATREYAEDVRRGQYPEAAKPAVPIAGTTLRK